MFVWKHGPDKSESNPGSTIGDHTSAQHTYGQLAHHDLRQPGLMAPLASHVTPEKPPRKRLNLTSSWGLCCSQHRKQYKQDTVLFSSSLVAQPSATFIPPWLISTSLEVRSAQSQHQKLCWTFTYHGIFVFFSKSVHQASWC